MNSLQRIHSLGFWSRIKMAWRVLRSPEPAPVIKFQNGVEFDLKNNRVILNNPVQIYSKETILIKSDKHVAIESGKAIDPRTGGKYSIWLNNPLGEDLVPDLLVHVYDQYGNAYDLPAEYDTRGNLIAPEGYSLQPPERKE